MTRKLTVLFETFWSDFADGWAIACRGYARAMELAGMEVGLTSSMGIPQDLSPEVIREVGHMVRPLSSWDAYIFSTAFGGPGKMQPPLWTLSRMCKPPRILYTMVERTSVHPYSAGQVDQLDALWVPCRASAEAFIRSGVRAQKTYSIPHVFFPDDPHLGLAGLSRRSGPPRFYWIGRWEPRKAPDNLIRAFLRAFRPGEATLTIKIGSFPFPTKNFPEGPEVVIADEISTNPDVRAKGWEYDRVTRDGHIQIVRGKIPSTEMVRMHAEHDVYVSPSRGEGWDLPAFAAKLAGRRVVATKSGGPQEFLSDDDIQIPTSGYVLAAPEYGWEPEAEYIDYRVDDMVAALQSAAKEVGRPAASWDKDPFKAKAVGGKLRKMVERSMEQYTR